MEKIAFGAKVSAAFRQTVIADSLALGLNPDWTMTVMAFETGQTFSPKVKNLSGSSAIGLIQFMTTTAAALGTTTEQLSKMTAVEQLAYVKRYLQPWAKSIKNLGDLYAAVLWPGMIGQPDTAVVFKAGGNRPLAYFQNKGLDINKDGAVTRGEILQKINAMYAVGRRPENMA